jgi:hypothetical protein
MKSKKKKKKKIQIVAEGHNVTYNGINSTKHMREATGAISVHVSENGGT